MLVVNRYLKKPKFLTPRDVVESLTLSKGQTVIDYGSGAGFWAIPLARAVGPKGVVYAIEASAEKLQVLSSLAKMSRVSNVKTATFKKIGDPTALKQKVDLILLTNVLSEIKKHDDLLSSLASNAEVGTKLVVVEWNMDSALGPAAHQRIIEDQVILLAARAGFRFVKQLDTGTFHYGLMFTYTGEKFHARKK